MFVHDVTAQKKLQELPRTQRLESLGLMAGGIAHDLNNVLTPIGLGLELLQGVSDLEVRQSLVDTLHKGVDRGCGVDPADPRVASGKAGERSPLQSCNSSMLDTLQLLQHALPKTIVIETELAGDLLPVVGDATQLNQVVLNLCINARDAMPKGGRLSVSAFWQSHAERR